MKNKRIVVTHYGGPDALQLLEEDCPEPKKDEVRVKVLAAAVFDGIGGKHIWESRAAVRRGGRVVAYGLTGSLHGGRVDSNRAGRRNRFGEIRVWAMYIIRSFLVPGRKRVVLYSIQWLMRLKPNVFREDLMALFDLLKQQKIKPIIAQRFPLADARKAHEMLGAGGVTGKLVLVTDPLRSI